MKSNLVKIVDGKKTLFGVEIKRNDINQTCLWKIFNNVISDEEMKETEKRKIICSLKSEFPYQFDRAKECLKSKKKVNLIEALEVSIDE